MGIVKSKLDPVAAELKSLLGDRFSTAEAVRRHHGEDASYHEPALPDAVAFATSTEEVAEIVKVCARHDCPVVPFGTGTSLEGQVMALSGGVSIDLSQMNEILEVHAEDLNCRVQAGVTRKQLNQHLRDTGLFFPIDPGADASLGGMASTSASGTNAVRYGTMRENVIGLTVVLADGRIIQTGTRAKKSAAGYDLTRLFVGSEGTLGVITEVGLKLFGIPEATSAAVCSFETLEGAVNTVILTIQMGIPVARVELLDEVQMDAVNRYSDLDYPARPTLFFEFQGSETAVTEQAESVGAVAAEFGGEDFRWATRQEDRSRLWQARHDAYFAALALRPGSKGWPTDVCVPISRLADCLIETKKDIEQAKLLAPIVGHVGDGNFHLTFVVDPNDAEEMRRCEEVNERMVLRAIDLGGTCTGEHGIGYGKIPFLEREHGDAVEVMRQLKTTLDPKGLFNPGKIFRA
jgi:D-lactate dehydrogenase (cytochrome)